MNKQITKVYVVYRTDGKRPFGLFLNESCARAFIDHCMSQKNLVRVEERKINWRWSGLKKKVHHKTIIAMKENGLLEATATP